MASGSAPALRHSQADCRAIGSFSSPSDAPSRMPGYLGQQVAAPVRELAELAHRCGFLVAGQLAPLGVMPGGAGELRDEDPVTIRAPGGGRPCSPVSLICTEKLRRTASYVTAGAEVGIRQAAASARSAAAMAAATGSRAR